LSLKTEAEVTSETLWFLKLLKKTDKKKLFHKKPLQFRLNIILT
jgi:hypothetical protein